MGLGDQAKTSFSDYKKILVKYFQADSDGAHNIIMLGVKDVHDYVDIVKRQSELDENSPSITWSQYLQNKQ